LQIAQGGVPSLLPAANFLSGCPQGYITFDADDAVADVVSPTTLVDGFQYDRPRRSVLDAAKGDYDDDDHVGGVVSGKPAAADGDCSDDGDGGGEGEGDSDDGSHGTGGRERKESSGSGPRRRDTAPGSKLNHERPPSPPKRTWTPHARYFVPPDARQLPPGALIELLAEYMGLTLPPSIIMVTGGAGGLDDFVRNAAGGMGGEFRACTSGEFGGFCLFFLFFVFCF
jgi:hypothetical protein